LAQLAQVLAVLQSTQLVTLQGTQPLAGERVNPFKQVWQTLFATQTEQLPKAHD
jgi:hypothetical protein